jgi:hypothetical protein
MVVKLKRPWPITESASPKKRYIPVLREFNMLGGVGKSNLLLILARFTGRLCDPMDRIQLLWGSLSRGSGILRCLFRRAAVNAIDVRHVRERR